jgi:putative redox protein
MSMTIGLYARRKQWPLAAIEIRLRHSRIHARDCADCVTKDKDTMLDRIATEVKLEGSLSPEQRAKLLDVGERCPVHQTLKSEIDITAVAV